ncbi:hypothetical protein CC86DRAFT_240718, partial [Ophiobolus disseminans]
VERQRLIFARDTHWTPPEVLVKRFLKILQQSDHDLKKYSSGARSVRTRARRRAAQIRQTVGPEVLLLVMLHVKTFKRLVELREDGLISSLHDWWDQKPHPLLLSRAASNVFSGNIMDVPQEPLSEPITSGQIAAAAFSNAIYLAAQSIPNLQDRGAWITSAHAHLDLLKRLNRYEADPWSSFEAAAHWASLPLLDSILGGYLSRGMYETCIRKDEEQSGATVITNAVRLWYALEQHGDFGLEIWLGSSWGDEITQQLEEMTSIEGWKNILGDYLYQAMTKSRFRESEVSRSILRTGAARISKGSVIGSDSKLEVLICFQTGIEIW